MHVCTEPQYISVQDLMLCVDDSLKIHLHASAQKKVHYCSKLGIQPFS